MSVELATRGFCVDAIDSVPEMRVLAAQAVHQSGLQHRVAVLPGNAYKLDIRNATYDLVVALGVLPWVRVPRRVISEMRRVLRPGGYLLVSTDNYWRLNHLLDPRLSPLLSPFRKATVGALEKVGRDSASTRSILRFDRCKAVDKMLEDADLHVHRRSTMGFGPFSFWRRQIFSQKLGIRIDARLQTAADKGHPLLKRSGSHYLVLARVG